MTEKRFTFQNQEQHLNKIYDNEKGRVVFDKDLCDLLNEQHERIEDYNVALKTLQDLADKKLKENEELKSENQYLKSLKWNKDCINEISIGMQQRQSIERQNNKLVKENEKLKSEIHLLNIEMVKTKSYEQLEKELNRFKKKNEELKKELQRMYDVATLNKAIGVLEEKYDRILSEGSGEVKDAMRYTVLRCIEDLDELKDDITAR